jgi:hypothetical protein
VEGEVAGDRLAQPLGLDRVGFEPRGGLLGGAGGGLRLAGVGGVTSLGAVVAAGLEELLALALALEAVTDDRPGRSP